jgi:hypothetical protein
VSDSYIPMYEYVLCHVNISDYIADGHIFQIVWSYYKVKCEVLCSKKMIELRFQLLKITLRPVLQNDSQVHSNTSTV